MIRLFRKIRQRLLSEKSYSIYLLYASGEILLVIAGILLAFQIDNWGDQKKQNKTEQGYLVALKSEFTQNLSIAEESIRTYEDMLTATGQLLEYTGPNVARISETETSKLLAKSMMNAAKYVPSPGILQDLINSGNLSQISNTLLRGLLSEWFILLDQTSRTENEAFYHRAALLDLLVQNIPFANIGRDIGYSDMVEAFPDGSNFKGEVGDILQLREFEGRMALYTANLWGLSSGSYLQIRLHAEKILDLIEDEMP